MCVGVGVQGGREGGGEAVCLGLLGRPSDRAHTPTPRRVSRINTRAAQILCSSPNGAPWRNLPGYLFFFCDSKAEEAGGGDGSSNPLNLFDESPQEACVKGRGRSGPVYMRTGLSENAEIFSRYRPGVSTKPAFLLKPHFLKKAPQEGYCMFENTALPGFV